MKLIDCCDNFGINYSVGFVTKSKVKEIKCQECRNFLCCPGTKSALIERKEFPECNLFCVNNDLQFFFKFTKTKLKKPIVLQLILFCKINFSVIWFPQ